MDGFDSNWVTQWLRKSVVDPNENEKLSIQPWNNWLYKSGSQPIKCGAAEWNWVINKHSQTEEFTTSVNKMHWVSFISHNGVAHCSVSYCDPFWLNWWRTHESVIPVLSIYNNPCKIEGKCVCFFFGSSFAQSVIAGRIGK